MGLFDDQSFIDTGVVGPFDGATADFNFVTDSASSAVADSSATPSSGIGDFFSKAWTGATSLFTGSTTASGANVAKDNSSVFSSAITGITNIVSGVTKAKNVVSSLISGKKSQPAVGSPNSMLPGSSSNTTMILYAAGGLVAAFLVYKFFFKK
jgi:hypothetical protein